MLESESRDDSGAEIILRNCVCLYRETDLMILSAAIMQTLLFVPRAKLAA